MTQRKRVMIVEDELITARAMQITLKAMGYEPCAMASTGDDAINRAETEKPDIILMDINLKGEMDGIEAARQIKTKSGVPIIFLSGYPDDERAKEAGADETCAYLVKPVEPVDIKMTIDSLLSKN